MFMLWPCALVAQLSQLWSLTTGATAAGRGGCVDIDNNDDVYVVGYVSGVLDGQSNAGGDDFVLRKYDSSGVKKWTRLKGSTSGDYGNGGI